MEKPYLKFDKKEIILRDELAIDRTILANERTLLAYIRTSLSFCIIGISAFKLFTSLVVIIAGYIIMGISLIILIFGFYRYIYLKTQIDFLRRSRKETNNAC